jgi:hypothetical protein
MSGSSIAGRQITVLEARQLALEILYRAEAEREAVDAEACHESTYSLDHY